jgi:hypothetical protein
VEALQEPLDGVFKALANNNIKIDIVAGTSIGGLNVTVIAGSNGDHPERGNWNISGWSLRREAVQT